MDRVIISIRPRWEGGYNIYLADGWVGGALSLEQARARAKALALEEAAKGQIALLATREDVFPHYSIEGFEKAFAGSFDLERKEPIRGSERVLYLMRGR